jgi:hypothetical protein
MSTGQHEPSDAAVHEFVQLLAGWVPDEKLASVRQTLADGKSSAAAATAAAMVAEHDVPLLAEDVDAARSLIGKPGPLKDVRPVDSHPRLPFWFSAFGPDERLDADDVDLVMAEAAQARSALIAGVWRAWRFPLDSFAEPDAEDQTAAKDETRPSATIDPDDPNRAHRVYIVQVPDGDAAPTLTGELQAALAGQGDAGVEVIALDTEPPPYQAAALDGSALLWAAQDDEPASEDEGPASEDEGPPFKVARVFDFAKPDTGPGFDPGHRVITDSDERDRLLAYLTSGTTVLHTTARTQDVLNPDAGQVVPTSFRTDGEWIWTDTVAYYLEQHSMAPDEELAAHIDACWQAGDVDAETDYDTAVEAANFLLYPPPEYARKAAWAPGAND